MNLSAPIPTSPPTSSSWQGHLDLAFDHTERGTQLSHRHVQAPLKVQRPFYPEGPEVCHLVTLHTAGGLVGGDRLSTSITLHPQAQALITTAAAGKVYRSNGPEAQQTVQVRVGAGACLEWLPQDTIVFDGACYQQRMRVDLADAAVWMGWDILRFGRTARGERFASGQWRSHTEVWQNGQRLWVDPQWLQGGSPMLDSPHGLNGCPVVASFALLGRPVSSDLIETARSLHPHPALHPSTATGVTRLMSGLLCRYRGHSTAEARHWFTQVWNAVRLEGGDRPACPPRVW